MDRHVPTFRACAILRSSITEMFARASWGHSRPLVTALLRSSCNRISTPSDDEDDAVRMLGHKRQNHELHNQWSIGTSKRVSIAEQCLVQKQSQSMSRHANCSGDAALNPLYGFPFHHIGWQRHDQLTGSRVAYFHGERHKQRESGHEQHTILLFFS